MKGIISYTYILCIESNVSLTKSNFNATELEILENNINLNGRFVHCENCS